MAKRPLLLLKDNFGNRKVPSDDEVVRAVADAVQAAFYRTDDDHAAYYVVASGERASIGRQALKESMHIDISIFPADEEVALWAFPSYKAASCAHVALKLSVAGSSWLVVYKDRPAYEDI